MNIEKVKKYAIESGKWHENELTFEECYLISKTTNYAFWNLRNELRAFSKPITDILKKIHQFIFP